MAGLDAWQMRGQARDLGASGNREDPQGSPHEYMPLMASETGHSHGDQHYDSRAPYDTPYQNRPGMGQNGANPYMNGGSHMNGGGLPSNGAGGNPFDSMRNLSQAGGYAPAQSQSHLLDPTAVPTGPDIVQFSAMFFYTHESEKKCSVTAMRIGSLQSTCAVNFKTEDNSAKAGVKYKATQGKIEFHPGEEMKSIEIKILDDDSFDTNLDFKVVMSQPSGCALGEHLHTCRIVIIDDDVFPTNKYKDQIMSENLDPVGVRLLMAFINFAFKRIPLVGWRTGWTLVLDQFANVNYLWGIWLNVYLVDVVLAVHREGSEEELWIKHQRLWTAVLVAFGFILPKAILDYIHWVKIGDMAIAGKVKLHMKVNLFRKYLYYSQDTHTKVSAQELTKAMEGDINELVMFGYMAIFQIAQQAVKVCVILCFLVHKRPSCALPLLIYPVAMALLLNLRYEQTLMNKDALRDAEKATMVCLRQSCDDLGLIKEYNMRNAVVNRYEDSIKDQGPAASRYLKYDFRTMLVMPWITHTAIAAFMIVGGHFVLTGDLSLGAYLATIGIYRDAGELFTGFYEHLKEFYGVIGPLLRVVRLLNLETDVQASMDQAQERRDGMLQELKAEEKMRRQYALSPRAISRFDMLHVKLCNASLANDRGGPQSPKLQDVSVEVPQGKMIAVLGPHGSGKFSLLRLLTGLVKPKSGIVNVPTHLRCLCLSNRPTFYKNGGLLENLTFGTQGHFDKNRLIKLCGAVGLGEHTMTILQQEMKEGVAEKANVVEKGVIPWYEQLSQSELLKMHITRALNLNPEVLLLHRPVDEMEADHAARLLDVMRQFVDHRGLFLTPQQRSYQRPHTVFFTSGEDRERSESAKDVADVVWHTHNEKGFWVEQGGHLAANSQREGRSADNKIVSSWSREVRTLQTNLEKEKHLHTATIEDLEAHRNDLEVSRAETDHLRGVVTDVNAQAKVAMRAAKAYEAELAAWEGEQAKNSWMPCVDRGLPPAPRQLSATLTQIISSGNVAQTDMKARSQSPPAYRHGPG